MIPMIPAIPSISATTTAGATLTGASSLGAVADTSSGSFQNILGQAIDSLSGVTNQANNLSLQAITGQGSLVDASVASTVASLDTQLAGAVASRAVTSLNAIMNMQL